MSPRLCIQQRYFRELAWQRSSLRPVGSEQVQRDDIISAAADHSALRASASVCPGFLVPNAAWSSLARRSSKVIAAFAPSNWALSVAFCCRGPCKVRRSVRTPAQLLPSGHGSRQAVPPARLCAPAYWSRIRLNALRLPCSICLTLPARSKRRAVPAFAWSADPGPPVHAIDSLAHAAPSTRFDSAPASRVRACVFIPVGSGAVRLRGVSRQGPGYAVPQCAEQFMKGLAGPSVLPSPARSMPIAATYCQARWGLLAEADPQAR
jgi:hypothetical protein